MQTRDQIEDIVKKGLVEDVFRMERAYALLRTSGEWAQEINAAGRGNFGELFGSLQAALITEAVLALARIYDTPDKRYPTRCLIGVLDHLIKYSEELPKIREPYQLKISLLTRVVPDELIKAIEISPDKFPLLLAKYVKAESELSEHINTLEKLKTFRDKALAHNERASPISGPSWDDLHGLLELAKYVIGALGWAYFSTAYTVNGEYLLSKDAKQPSLALSRLLKKLYGEIYPSTT
jgi:hypothetical protein